MAIQDYIRDILLFNGAVVLPGLGTFKIVEIPAEITGKKIVPPRSSIVFDPEQKSDDDVLVSRFSESEGIEHEEARQRILEFADDILFALNKGEGFDIKGLGMLSQDSDGIYHFEKDPDLVTDFSSFGLEDFELMDDEIEEGKPLTEENEISAEEPVKQGDLEAYEQDEHEDKESDEINHEEEAQSLGWPDKQEVDRDKDAEGGVGRTEETESESEKLGEPVDEMLEEDIVSDSQEEEVPIIDKEEVVSEVEMRKEEEAEHEISGVERREDKIAEEEVTFKDEISEGDKQDQDVPEVELHEDELTREEVTAKKDPYRRVQYEAAESYAVSREKKRKNRNTIWILVGVAAVILIALILIPLRDTIFDKDFQFAGSEFEVNDAFSELEEENGVFDEMVDNLEKDIDSTSKFNESEVVDEKTVIGYVEYHIIAGSFKSRNNAGKFQNELSMAGFPSTIIERGDGFYRVSARGYNNKDTALRELYVFREKKGMESAWIMGLK